MTNMIVKAGIAAIIALTGLSATAPTAAAAGPGPIEVQYRDRDWGHDRGPDRTHDRGWRPDRRPAGCSPWVAENKANRMGLRRTRLVGVSHRTVTVVGFGRRGPDRMVFANVRGCPLIHR